MKNRLFTILVAMVVLGLIPIWVFAGTTGKIAGTVTAEGTGEALPGVNVVIVGTTLGAVTDVDGHYSILNVPVGGHSLRISCVGYQTVLQQNVYVNIDLTTEVSLQLRQETLDIGEEIIVVADRPLIRKDETNTNVIRTVEEIKNMPVRGVQELAGMTAGVVKQDNSNVMNIRGGRGGETATYVDGVLVTDPYNAAMRLYIPNRAIEEISVQTGGFNAEYGEAMSGILAITTRAGRDKYHFSVEAVTDGFLSADKKTLGAYSYGFNEYTASLSGPIIPKKRHTFFLSATRNYTADWTPSWGWAENADKLTTYTYYQPILGFDEAGELTTVDTVQHDYQFNARLPENWDSQWSYTGKVHLQITNNMELKSSYIQTDRKYSTDWFGTASAIQPVYFFNTGHRAQFETHTSSFNATFTHLVSPKLFYDLKFNMLDTRRECYDPTFKRDFLKYGDPHYNPWPDTEEYYGQAYTGRLDPDFFQPGCQYDAYSKQRTSHWSVDLDLTHQWGKYQTIKAGVEYKYHTVRYFQIATPSKLSDPDFATDLERYRGADVRFYGYDVMGNEVDDGNYLEDVVRAENGLPISGFEKQEPYHPIFMNAYVQDKIEFEDLILNLGLRWDYINPNAWMFRQIGAEFNSDGSVVEGTGMFGGDRIFDSNDIVKSDAYSYISPRFGIGYPITDRTVFHAQYGKFYQSPQLIDLYMSPFYLDNYITIGYFTWFNNPNIRPPKTTSYEMGFKQTLSDYASVQLTAFYKETEDLIQLVTYNTDIRDIAFRENGDFGTIKGLDLIFNLRRYKNLSVNLNYELQFARGTGSASNSNYDIAWLNGANGNYPKFVQPLDFEQRHTGSLNLDYRFGRNNGPKVLRNSGINMVLSFNSGNPYTRMDLSGKFPFSGRYDNDNLSTVPATAVNSETTPWQYKIDLKIDRMFELMNTKLTVYAWVINLLNTANVQNVWITSGLPDDTGYLRTADGQRYWSELSDTQKSLYKMREVDYNFYGVPRQIRLGVQLEM
ncbi:TonB-dependent receptor [candidate division KSB1 bacterium]|nr:TonB-dependent receptor [candidate division KSB1 bacterium]